MTETKLLALVKKLDRPVTSRVLGLLCVAFVYAALARAMPDLRTADYEPLLRGTRILNALTTLSAALLLGILFGYDRLLHQPEDRFRRKEVLGIFFPLVVGLIVWGVQYWRMANEAQSSNQQIEFALVIGALFASAGWNMMRIEPRSRIHPALEFIAPLPPNWKLPCSWLNLNFALCISLVSLLPAVFLAHQWTHAESLKWP